MAEELYGLKLARDEVPEPYHGSIDGYTYDVFPGYDFPTVFLDIPNINQRYAIWRELYSIKVHGAFGVNVTTSWDYLYAIAFQHLSIDEEFFAHAEDFPGYLMWKYNAKYYGENGDYITGKRPNGKKWTLPEIIDDIRKVVEQIKKFECCRDCGECRGFSKEQMEAYESNINIDEIVKGRFFGVNKCTKFPDGILGKEV